MSNYDALKLENQLCFPLYAAAKEVVRKYRPLLDELDLTYTQYIVMMVLWEYGEMNVKDLGKRLYLDSGTLTPLLKTMEKKGYINRIRDKHDERNVVIRLTQEGDSLRERAVTVPEQMGKCVPLTSEEAVTLYKLLYKLLNSFDGSESDG